MSEPHTGLRAAAMLSALSVLILGACGSDGDSPPSATPETQTPVVATPTPVGLPGTYDLSRQSPQFLVYGAETGDLISGFSSVAAGDFNGDGARDLLIGAPFADGPDNSREDAGEAYVIFGPQLEGSADLAQGEHDLITFGGFAGDNLGLTVLALDLNGDGLDDMVAGAPGVTVFGGRDERTDQGRAYVFFGASDLSGSRDVAAGEFDFVITGAEGFSRIGHALAAGDVNGDAVADLVLGAPFAGREPGSPPGSARMEAGEVYVVYGSSSLAGELHIAFDPVGFTVSSEQRHGQFGAAVAAGDINGDGIDDVIAGAPQIDFGNREAAGAVYVFFGATDLGGRRFIAEGQQDAALIGEAGQSLGLPLSAGDVNGDGVGDLVAGARSASADDRRVAAGAAYVVFGRTDLRGDRDLSLGSADSVIFGAGAGHLIPTAMSVFDIAGDSASEIIISAASGPEERVQAGAVYILPGATELPNAMDLATVAAPAIIGAEGGDRLGSAFTAIPLESDSLPVLVLVASGADGPDNARKDAGEIYVVPTASLVSP